MDFVIFQTEVLGFFIFVLISWLNVQWKLNTIFAWAYQLTSVVHCMNFECVIKNCLYNWCIGKNDTIFKRFGKKALRKNSWRPDGFRWGTLKFLIIWIKAITNFSIVFFARWNTDFVSAYQLTLAVHGMNFDCLIIEIGCTSGVFFMYIFKSINLHRSA